MVTLWKMYGEISISLVYTPLSMFALYARTISLVAMSVEIICVEMLILSEEVASARVSVVMLMLTLCWLLRVIAL